MKAWKVIRDIVLTVLAVFIVVAQVIQVDSGKSASSLLLTFAALLVSPNVADHARAMLSASGDGESSSSEEEPAPSPSARRSAASGD